MYHDINMSLGGILVCMYFYDIYLISLAFIVYFIMFKPISARPKDCNKILLLIQIFLALFLSQLSSSLFLYLIFPCVQVIVSTLSMTLAMCASSYCGRIQKTMGFIKSWPQTSLARIEHRPRSGALAKNLLSTTHNCLREVIVCVTCMLWKKILGGERPILFVTIPFYYSIFHSILYHVLFSVPFFSSPFLFILYDSILFCTILFFTTTEATYLVSESKRNPSRLLQYLIWCLKQSKQRREILLNLCVKSVVTRVHVLRGGSMAPLLSM